MNPPFFRGFSRRRELLTLVPFENAERFAGLMRKKGNVCQLVAFPHKDHGFFNSKEFNVALDNKDFLATMQASDNFLVSLGLIPHGSVRRSATRNDKTQRDVTPEQ